MSQILYRYALLILALFMYKVNTVWSTQTSLSDGNESQYVSRRIQATEAFGPEFVKFHQLAIQNGVCIEDFYSNQKDSRALIKAKKFLSGYAAHGLKEFISTCNDLGLPQALLNQHQDLIERMRLEMIAEGNAPKVPHFDLTRSESASRKFSSGSESSLEPGEQLNEDEQIEGVPQSSTVKRRLMVKSAASTDSSGSDSEGASASQN